MAVPELAAKKAKREEALQAQRAADALESRKKAKETRRVIFKKAAAYVNEYRQQASGRGRGGGGRGRQRKDGHTQRTRSIGVVPRLCLLPPFLCAPGTPSSQAHGTELLDAEDEEGPLSL